MKENISNYIGKDQYTVMLLIKQLYPNKNIRICSNIDFTQNTFYSNTIRILVQDGVVVNIQEG
jgi:hypothetical protein